MEASEHTDHRLGPSEAQFTNTGLYLTNEFHFSDVHRSMNALGHVQSKLTLLGTHCVHYRNEFYFCGFYRRPFIHRGQSIFTLCH